MPDAPRRGVQRKALAGENIRVLQAVGLFCVCGPFSGTLEYSVDNAPYKKLDTYTEWSKNLYIPWAYVLEAELNPEREHKLTVRISKEKNKNSFLLSLSV